MEIDDILIQKAVIQAAGKALTGWHFFQQEQHFPFRKNARFEYLQYKAIAFKLGIKKEKWKEVVSESLAVWEYKREKETHERIFSRS